MAARILLVEDEPQLRDLLQKYVTRLGFEVDAYPRALDALQSYEAGVRRYQLVIADLGIPDMPGDALLTRMLNLNPSQLILICSGSPFNVSNLPETMQAQVRFLQKPFVPKMLAEAIEDLLSNRR